MGAKRRPVGVGVGVEKAEEDLGHDPPSDGAEGEAVGGLLGLPGSWKASPAPGRLPQGRTVV